jgi:hypothetical protein
MSRSYIASPPWRLHGGSGTALLTLRSDFPPRFTVIFETSVSKEWLHAANVLNLWSVTYRGDLHCPVMVYS